MDVEKQALARRVALLKQREAIDAEIAKVDDFLKMLGTFVKTAERPQRGRKRAVPAAEAPVVLDAALRLLGDGKWHATRGMLGELRAFGIEVKGKDEAAKVISLSAILGRARNERGLPLKVDRTKGWIYFVDKGPKAKAPVNGDASTGAELRVNSTLSAS